MRDDDDKTLLTVATLAVGALTAFGAFMALTDRVEKSRESDKKDVHGAGKNVSKLPKIYSFIKLGGKDYTVHVDPYDLENTTLTGHVSEEHFYRQGPPAPRKCTDAEFKEVYKCLWCNEWRAEGGQTLDPQTRGKILTMIDEYIKYR